MIFKLNIFYKEAILFAAAQLVGIYTALKIISGAEFSGGQRPNNFSNFSFIDFIIMAVIIFMFIFFSKRGGRAGAIFYKIFLGFALFGGSQLALQSFMNPTAAFFVAIGLVFWFLYKNNVIIQNLIMVFALAGIGAIFGLSLEPTVAVILLLVFSVYDIIAVYKTGHMIKLAETMIKSKAIFGFVIPSRLHLFKEKVQNVNPGDDFMILGSGDIIMPIILASSVLVFSSIQAYFIAIFSVVGLFITHLLFSNQKVRRPMAALPPIAVMSIIGYLVSHLFI
ncbi:MAG: presenilin family intramembrane aspartyl protease [bacterium]|nr:presenilin family intramembrane aspartyl protease [bacterium]